MTQQQQHDYERARDAKADVGAGLVGIIEARVKSGDIAPDDELAKLAAEWERAHETACHLTGAPHECNRAAKEGA